MQPKPNTGKVFWYSLLSKIFGYTFALKLMENGEDKADKAYTSLIQEIPEAEKIAEDEERHEQALLAMLDEDVYKRQGLSGPGEDWLRKNRGLRTPRLPTMSF